MGNKKIQAFLSSLTVIFLYFLWPYFVSLITKSLGVSTTTSLIIKFLANFALLFIVAFIYRESIKNNVKSFKKDWKKNFKKIVLTFVFACVIFYALKMLIVLLFPDVVFEDATSLAKEFSKFPALLIISTLFYYPVIEELVFKRTFKELINIKWFFIIATALLNASFQVLLTASNSLSLVTILPNFMFYATLSYIYYETDNLLIAISVRVFYNLIPNIVYFIF